MTAAMRVMNDMDDTQVVLALFSQPLPTLWPLSFTPWYRPILDQRRATIRPITHRGILYVDAAVHPTWST